MGHGWKQMALHLEFRMFAAVPPLDPFPRSHIMFSHSTADANKFSEPPLSHAGATPDADRAKQPPLPEPPYHPYTSEPARPEPPYKPYVKEPTVPGPPYEPYKGM